VQLYTDYNQDGTFVSIQPVPREYIEPLPGELIEPVPKEFIEIDE